MRLHIFIISASLALYSLDSVAADGLKPGQWNVTVKSDQMAAMPQIPPEQLAQMKKMGINIPSGGQGMEVQTCIKPDQASFEKAAQQQNKDCKTKNFKHSGNKVTGEMVCTGDINGTGKFEMTLDGDTSYTSKMTMKGTSKDAGPIDQTMESKGQWVKAECDPQVAARHK